MFPKYAPVVVYTKCLACTGLCRSGPIKSEETNGWANRRARGHAHTPALHSTCSPVHPAKPQQHQRHFNTSKNTEVTIANASIVYNPTHRDKIKLSICESRSNILKSSYVNFSLKNGRSRKPPSWRMERERELRQNEPTAERQPEGPR